MDQEGEDPFFAVTTAVAGEQVTVTVTGEVDMSTAGRMRAAAIRPPFTAVTVDLTAVTFFDSAAIHALLQLAEQFGAGLSVRASPQVRRVLEISGLAGQPWLISG